MRENFQKPDPEETKKQSSLRDENLNPERADMVRAQARINPENRIFVGYDKKNDWKPVFREATPEDYAQAIEAIDQLEEQAKKEPAIKDVLMHIARLGERTKFLIGEVLRFPGELLNSLPSGEGGESESRAEEHKVKLEENLKTARMRLNELKRKAEKFRTKKEGSEIEG